MSGSAPALVAEAIGTFLFFFIAAGAALVATGDPAATLLIVALAHGVVLAVLVSSFGAVSGGHFNPAVTLGLWIAGQVDAMKGVAYMVAQLVGGAAAGFALAYFFGDVGPAVPALGEGVDVTEGILLEAIMTTVLLFAVFGTAVDARGPKIGGLAIGLAVAADILLHFQQHHLAHRRRERAGGLHGGHRRRAGRVRTHHRPRHDRRRRCR